VAHEDWRSPDHVDTHFMPFNGPSVEFSQNFSQNSLMLSHRQDEDSRDYNQGYRYKKLLEEKKREEEQFNEVLDKELTAVKQELERSRFEVSKLQGLVKGLETKVKRKDEEIKELDDGVAALQEEIDQLKEEKAEYLESLVKKDDFFMQHRNETTKIMNRLSDKEKENHELQNEIDSLHKELQRLTDALAVYNEPDRRLLDFRGYSYETYGYDAPKKGAQGDRELEKLRKEKGGLEIELSAARDKLEDRESRYKIAEEEGRKKLAHKERKIQELEQKITEQKEEHMKTKTQL
jgi:chromosome segregation ATPase